MAGIRNNAPPLGPGVSYSEARKQFDKTEWWNAIPSGDRRSERCVCLCCCDSFNMFYVHGFLRQELYEEWEWNLQRQKWQNEEKISKDAAEEMKRDIAANVKSETFTYAAFKSAFENAQW